MGQPSIWTLIHLKYQERGKMSLQRTFGGALGALTCSGADHEEQKAFARLAAPGWSGLSELQQYGGRAGPSKRLRGVWP